MPSSKVCNVTQDSSVNLVTFSFPVSCNNKQIELNLSQIEDIANLALECLIEYKLKKSSLSCRLSNIKALLLLSSIEVY